MRAEFALLIFRHDLPVEIQALDERLPLPRVVGLEAQFEQRALDPGEAPSQIFRRGEGQAEDEVGVVVLLTLQLELFILSAQRRGGVGVEREVFLEERGDVRGGLGGGFVPERAGFQLGEDCTGTVSISNSFEPMEQGETNFSVCRSPTARTARA